MKSFYKASVIFVFGVLLSACGQATLMAPTPVILTYTPAPAVTFEATVTSVPTITPKPTKHPIAATPTPFVDFLESAFSIQDVDSVGGHNLRKITGWDEGIYSFEWMASSHLLLYSIVGQSMLSYGNYELYPIVINLSSSETWLPSSKKITERDLYWWTENKYQPRWSAELEILISIPNTAEDSIALYSADGDLIEIYGGELIDISPSGTKLLIADDTWVDLSSKEIVDFGWYQNNRGNPSFSFRPIWSADETRVYTCCYLYGDAKTGEGFGIPYDDISIDGKKRDKEEKAYWDYYLYNYFGTWVLNDSYLLSQWGGIWDGNPGFIPLFDPSAKTYRSLNTLSGIPSEYEGQPSCIKSFAASGGRYVLMVCNGGSYLVDLLTFDSVLFPSINVSNVNWSANGKFAWINNYDDDVHQILSVSSKELMSLPTDLL